MSEGTTQVKLETYRRLGRTIGLGRKLDLLLERLLGIMVSTLEAREVVVALAEGGEGHISVRSSRGLSPEAAAAILADLETSQALAVSSEGRPFYILRGLNHAMSVAHNASPSPSRQALRLLAAPIGQPQDPKGLLLTDRLFGDEVDPSEDLAFLGELAQVASQFVMLEKDLRQAARSEADGSPVWGSLGRQAISQLALAGQSPAIRQARRLLEKVAPSKAPVLLLGEAGVGKHMAAQFIHQHSEVARGELVWANCAAWPETHLEAALFGCEPGACPEVAGPLAGRLELAHGGTAYLEAIDRLSLPLQTKLLRLIQEHELERLGGSHPLPADVRIVAGCPSDLKNAVDRGRFREDLYYRLNVFPVRLPPLRERAEDIPLLLDRLLDLQAEDMGCRLSMTPKALDRLCGYHWPGNLREMANLLERIALLGDVSSIDLPDLSALMAPPPEEWTADLAEQSLSRLEEMERREVVAALERNNWVQSHAARELGLTLRQIGYRIKKYGLDRTTPKRPGRSPARPLPQHPAHFPALR